MFVEGLCDNMKVILSINVMRAFEVIPNLEHSRFEKVGLFIFSKNG